MFNWSTDQLSYCIILQCLCEILYTFSTDSILLKYESGQCLYSWKVICMQWIRRSVVSLYCSVMLERCALHLHPQFRCLQDQEWLVSMLIKRIMRLYTVDQKISCITVLLCSALASSCAPSPRTLLFWRSRVVSVYNYQKYCMCSWSEETLSYCVLVQYLSEILCSFITDTA